MSALRTGIAQPLPPLQPPLRPLWALQHGHYSLFIPPSSHCHTIPHHHHSHSHPIHLAFSYYLTLTLVCPCTTGPLSATTCVSRSLHSCHSPSAAVLSTMSSCSFSLLSLLSLLLLAVVCLCPGLSSAQSATATAAATAAATTANTSTAAASTTSPSTSIAPGDWPVWGGDWNNDKYASSSSGQPLTASSVGRLVEQFRWSFNGSVGGLPVVVGPYVYFNVQSSTSSLVGGQLVPIPSHSRLVCGNRLTASIVWEVDMTVEIAWRNTLQPNKPDNSTVSPSVRGSPAVQGSYVWVGGEAGAWLFKLNRFTGQILLATRVDEHPLAIITAALVVYGSKLYVGVSSFEELYAANHPTYVTSFRGSVVALDTTTMAIVAQVFVIPPPDLAATVPPSVNGPGVATWSGGAVWGSSFVVDPLRNVLYFGTGNEYSVPPAVDACRKAYLSSPQDVVGNPCRVPGDLSEAVVAVTLDTLEIVWATAVGQVDTWTVACGTAGGTGGGQPPFPWCSSTTPGDDFDFGQAPVLVRNVRFTSLQSSHGPAQAVDGLFIGQKSGALWAFRADTGALMWVKQVGPGGEGGGLQWGVSADSDTIYASSANTNGVIDSANDMNHPTGRAINTTAGKFVAVHQVDGSLKWQVLDTSFLAASATATNTAYGTTSVLPGVVIAPLTSVDGTWHALSAATGQSLGTWKAGAPITYGAAIAQGQILVSTGADLATGPAGGLAYPAVVVYGLPKQG